MKPGNWRLQARKRDRVFLGVLRKGLGHQVILDIPRRMRVGFARQPGTRIWFTVLGSTLLVTGQPCGQRGERRYSSRLMRTYLPLRLLLPNRVKCATNKGRREHG